MNVRNLFVASIVATSLLATPVVHAASGVKSPVRAMFGKTKTIKLTLMNDSGAPMEVKAGDDVIKLDAGKPVIVNLAPGTRVVSNSKTALHDVGTLIAEVSSSLSGATIHIK